MKSGTDNTLKSFTENTLNEFTKMKEPMQKLKEKQDRELKCKINTSQEFGGFSFPVCGYEKAEENLRNFLDKVRKETAEMVCDRMIGKERKTKFYVDEGYDTRIKEEKEIIIENIMGY